MFKIKTLNSISEVIHKHLSANQFIISNEEPVPDGILVRSASMHDMALEENLLAIARAGAGVNNIPIEECTKRGIVVFNTPGANANAVAELVICGLMLGSRNVGGGIQWAQQLKGQGEKVPALVEKGKAQFSGPEVRGKTLGVIGLGAIGVMVANASSDGLGMNVIGYDPYISVEHAWSLNRNIKYCETIEEIFENADYITLHLPLISETRAIINEKAINKMKKGVHILNFSRAELVDLKAMASALENDYIASYVTDFPNEEVLAMKNTIAIPHLGASTPESEENCAQMASSQLNDYLITGQIKNSVNFPEILLGKSEGNRIIVIHENEPGMVSAISSIIGARKININNMQNKNRNNIAITILEIEQVPQERLLTELLALPGVIRVRSLG